MYKLLRKVFFFFDAESVHYFAMDMLRSLCSVGILRKFIENIYKPAGNLTKNEFGLIFRNPVGMAAGFDKNARYLRELEALGFGSVEIGTVTPQPQAGNEKPRLFRLQKDQAIINRMGFNNDGVKAISERLKDWQEKRNQHSSLPMIIGGNIGKNKTTPNDEAWKDYETCFRGLYNYVDYFVVNVSSPNTPGLRALQEKDSLRKILSHLQTINMLEAVPKPVLLKIAPDLTLTQLDDVIDLCMEIKIDGLVATNTTIDRSGLVTDKSTIQHIGAGGLSGRPVFARSTEIVAYIHRKSGGAFPIIASGGIFTGDDAKQKMAAGAGLVQVWTGFIYEGPAIVKNICRNL